MQNVNEVLEKMQSEGEALSKVSEIASKLGAPFKEVKTRPGPGGKPLSYITARQVMDRLDNVVGPAGWQTKYIDAGMGITCELSVKYGDEWITKSDGAGATSIAAEKGGHSGAFKRAAVHHGIARELYDEDLEYLPFGRGVVADVLHSEGADVDGRVVAEYSAAIEARASSEDNHGLLELITELKGRGDDQHTYLAVWKTLHSKTRAYIKSNLKGST